LVKPLAPVILGAKVAGLVELFQKSKQIRQMENRALHPEDRERFSHAWYSSVRARVFLNAASFESGFRKFGVVKPEL
jgi:hypothetical protein